MLKHICVESHGEEITTVAVFPAVVPSKKKGEEKWITRIHYGKEVLKQRNKGVTGC
jgi:hypothetical protein